MNINSLITLWNLTQEHPGTSGARAAVGILLGLYNGSRFPMDLRDLRLLDGRRITAALSVIDADASRCRLELHEWLNQVTGRRDFGARFEQLAHDYPLKGRCSRENLVPVSPCRLIIV
jgi:hypothetical protein